MEPQVEARQSKVTARWTFLSLHLYLRCKAMFFVLILKPQNTFLILEERLCLNIPVFLYTTGLKYPEDKLCVIA